MMMMADVLVPLSDVSTSDSELSSSFDQATTARSSGSDASSSDDSSSCNDEDHELSEFLWHAFVASEETHAVEGHPPLPLLAPPYQAQVGEGDVDCHDGAVLFPMFAPDPELDALCL